MISVYLMWSALAGFLLMVGYALGWSQGFKERNEVDAAVAKWAASHLGGPYLRLVKSERSDSHKNREVKVTPTPSSDGNYPPCA